jgi:hypothetical protein
VIANSYLVYCPSTYSLRTPSLHSTIAKRV